MRLALFLLIGAAIGFVGGLGTFEWINHDRLSQISATEDAFAGAKQQLQNRNDALLHANAALASAQEEAERLKRKQQSLQNVADLFGELLTLQGFVLPGNLPDDPIQAIQIQLTAARDQMIQRTRSTARSDEDVTVIGPGRPGDAVLIVNRSDEYWKDRCLMAESILKGKMNPGDSSELTATADQNDWRMRCEAAEQVLKRRCEPGVFKEYEALVARWSSILGTDDWAEMWTQTEPLIGSILTPSRAQQDAIQSGSGNVAGGEFRYDIKRWWFEGETLNIQGEITNLGSKHWEVASLQTAVRDSSGEFLGVIADIVNNLAPGQTKPFHTWTLDAKQGENLQFETSFDNGIERE